MSDDSTKGKSRTSRLSRTRHACHAYCSLKVDHMKLSIWTIQEKFDNKDDYFNLKTYLFILVFFTLSYVPTNGVAPSFGI